MGTYESLIVERRGNVGWLIFNRPEAMNSHSLTMLAELPRAWAELSADDDVRVIVNTGRGRAFCTGADVKEFAEQFRMRINQPLHRLQKCEQKSQHRQHACDADRRLNH